MTEHAVQNVINRQWFKRKTVTVFGLGKSGVAAIRLLQTIGASVRIADHKPVSALASQLSHIESDNLDIFAGARCEEGFSGADCIVISPGVPSDTAILQRMRSQGVPVIGELELASHFLSSQLIAVTGTNGKSTVVSLIAQMCEEDGQHVFLGGNLGTPLCEAVIPIRHSSKDEASCPTFDAIVAEVSSFQLETIDQFHPSIAVWLNLTGDHLDRYSSMHQYALAKARIFENQRLGDDAVLNMDDPTVAVMASRLSSTTYGFSVRRPVEQGAFLDGDCLVAVMDKTRYELGEIRDVGLRGEHNIANVLAASMVGLLCHCSPGAIQRAIHSFQGIPHALEVVRERQGVLYVNDSKGTNVDATIQAITRFHAPLFIILGGKDKGGDFGRLREPLQRTARKVLLVGEAAPRIQEALQGLDVVVRVPSLQCAVDLASREAQVGDVVLLSPACASFDMFRDYLDRGEQFREAVNALS